MKGQWGGHRAPRSTAASTARRLRAIAAAGTSAARLLRRRADAVAAGDRPCATCCRDRYDAWKAARRKRRCGGPLVAWPACRIRCAPSWPRPDPGRGPRGYHAGAARHRIIRLLDQVWPLLREQGARTGHNVVIYYPGAERRAGHRRRGRGTRRLHGARRGPPRRHARRRGRRGHALRRLRRPGRRVRGPGAVVHRERPPAVGHQLGGLRRLGRGPRQAANRRLLPALAAPRPQSLTWLPAGPPPPA